MTRSACYKSGIQPVRRDFNHCHQRFTEGQIAAVWSTILQVHKVSKVYRNGNQIKLSPKEYELLLYFMTNPKLVFSREQLLDKVWGLESDIEIRTVDVHIRRLRKAIKFTVFRSY